MEPPRADAIDGAAIARILVVLDSSPATAALVDAVRVRAARGPARFHVLVQHPAGGIGPRPRALLATTIPLMGAARGSVSTRRHPLDAIADTVADRHFDQLIVAAAPRRVPRWLHIDLLDRLARLGLPVTTVVGQAPELKLATT